MTLTQGSSTWAGQSFLVLGSLSPGKCAAPNFSYHLRFLILVLALFPTGKFLSLLLGRLHLIKIDMPRSGASTENAFTHSIDIY